MYARVKAEEESQQHEDMTSFAVEFKRVIFAAV
jgi:hypothetical protein